MGEEGGKKKTAGIRNVREEERSEGDNRESCDNQRNVRLAQQSRNVLHAFLYTQRT